MTKCHQQIEATSIVIAINGLTSDMPSQTIDTREYKFCFGRPTKELSARAKEIIYRTGQQMRFSPVQFNYLPSLHAISNNPAR